MPERSPRPFEHPDPSRDDAHDLLPSWLATQVPGLYDTEDDADPLVMAKFFTPDSSWTWYVTESDGHDLCFGLVDGLATELGYFSLDELRQVRGPLGSEIERDMWFEPTPFSKIKQQIAEQHAPDNSP